MSASAIAVTPVAQNNTVIQQAKSLAYDLTATMDATASPVDVYGSLFEATFDNLQSLGGAVAANPAPLLSQVMENQLGYAEKFGAAFEAIPTSLQNWYDGRNGKIKLDAAQAALQNGDVAGAYELFNASMLYAFQGAFGPLIAPGFILSGIPRNGTEYMVGIPEQIAQNFTNLVAATFTSSVVVSALFQGGFAMVSGPAFELARVAEAISTSVSTGDMEGAFNAVVNTPGILVNAALNGFDYADPDESGAGGYTEWPALLTWAEPGEQGGSRVVAGLLQNLLVNIPKSLADAIDNTPEVAAPSAVPTSVSAQLVSAVTPKAASTESAVESVKEAAPAVEAPKAETPAVESPKVETPAAETPAVETPKVETPAVEAVKVETPVADAVPAATEEAAADSATAPTAPKSVAAETKGKTKVADRIKAKISEAKQAKEAKAKQAKEAKESKAATAKAKPAKTKAGGADKSKGSSDSKKSSGSDS
ncbi:hypothetical protein BKG60_01355 [Mycobacterium syngnathidarum]|nr:hypothetical protein BKG60_01355 [Mycobacterium syngnathidarum]